MLPGKLKSYQIDHIERINILLQLLYNLPKDMKETTELRAHIANEVESFTNSLKETK